MGGNTSLSLSNVLTDSSMDALLYCPSLAVSIIAKAHKLVDICRLLSTFSRIVSANRVAAGKLPTFLRNFKYSR